VRNRFQAFAFKCNVYRYTAADGTKPPTLAEVKYGGISSRVRSADRTVGNYLEQTPPFLAALWLHAAFVSPASAAAGGGLSLALQSSTCLSLISAVLLSLLPLK
jgi:hypothetical protein